jgi:hypothetical protein
MRGQVERRFVFRDPQVQNTVEYGIPLAIKQFLWKVSYAYCDIKYMNLKWGTIYDPLLLR